MTSPATSEKCIRPVLRGADRDAAVLAAACWYRERPDVADALNTIAGMFNVSLTAAAEAILVARSEAATNEVCDAFRREMDGPT